MRLKINLATTPYENARRFYLRWGFALAVMVAITVVLVVAAARTWRANHALARSIADERARLEKLNQQERADLAILQEPQNQGVRDRSQALNALIVRKSFSWTRIFNDLEKMMPTQLHVVSITPQLSAANELEIRMMVAGTSRDKAIQLVQNMEKAPDFSGAQIVSEYASTKGTQASDAVTFDIVAQYTPSNVGQKNNEAAPAMAADREPGPSVAAEGNSLAADGRSGDRAPAAPPKTRPAKSSPKPSPKGGTR